MVLSAGGTNPGSKLPLSEQRVAKKVELRRLGNGKPGNAFYVNVLKFVLAPRLVVPQRSALRTATVSDILALDRTIEYL
ncbi:hypothetical protein BCF46_2949 [Litoreibacter meonggei]|uniref:Uncharacterized protein n=1 Tax=Litoreibacter meonggei TaxID=1049199 RepID=A0A497VC40_9RHOB|nr:hypothetical protein BCF46_2949 [Litoreibacter meonggei]